MCCLFVIALDSLTAIVVASAPFFPNLAPSASGICFFNNSATSISNLLLTLKVDPKFNCFLIALFTSGSAYPSING